jgi:hypothetical protein
VEKLNEFNGLADPTPGLPLDPTSRVPLDPPPVEKFSPLRWKRSHPFGGKVQRSLGALPPRLRNLFHIAPSVEKFSAALALCPHDCATFSI